MGFIKDAIRKWVNSEMNVIPTNSKDEFYNEKVNDWYSLYNGDLILGKNKSLNLPKTIINEVCKTAIHEFTFKTSTGNKNIEYASKFLQKNIGLLATHLTISGSIALKPYISKNRIGVVIVPATNFKAEFDSFGELKQVKFKSVIKENNVVFTLIETHEFNKMTSEYNIEYKLYRSSGYGLSTVGGYGSEVPLSTCSETAGLLDFIEIKDVKKHLCVVKTLNNTEFSNVGESIFASALDLICDASNQFDRVMWEYEGGQLAVQANAELFHKAGSSIAKQNYTLPEGKERLYIALPGASNEFSIDTFAPTLRDSSYWVGFNNILRRIEFACGLSYGVLSDANEQAKTATEITASKQRYYMTISNIRSVMCECIDEVIESVSLLCENIDNSLADNSYTITYDIEDGILQTTEEKINARLLLVDKGVMTVDEFKNWFYSKSNK